MEPTQAAHLARRTNLGLDPARIDRLTEMSWDDALTAVLTADSTPEATVPVTDEWADAAVWWIDHAVKTDAGLTDRLVWFWHGLLTTNAWTVSSPTLIGAQLQVLRDEARGDYRSLLHAFVGSGALLDFLNASWSVASNPNENLARELMELFTVGRGNYSEDDVRAAARALSGWVVEDAEVSFVRENAFIAPLIFLGEQRNWDTASVIDRLCDHPATAVRVAHRMWQEFVGTDLSEAAQAELGAWWQGHDLEIMPLMERILRSAEFRRTDTIRPRCAFEWFCAAWSATGAADDNNWQLEELGQMPYLPPNVAGWPRGNRWLSPGSLLARANVAHSFDLEHLAPEEGASATPTAEVLYRCGLLDASHATRNAIENATTHPDLSPAGATLARWRLAITSPEFHLS